MVIYCAMVGMDALQTMFSDCESVSLSLTGHLEFLTLSEYVFRAKPGMVVVRVENLLDLC